MEIHDDTDSSISENPDIKLKIECIILSDNFKSIVLLEIFKSS